VDVFKQMKEFYWPKRHLLYAAIFCLVCGSLLGLVYPNLLRILIDQVITKKQYQEVPKLALLVILVVSIKGMFQFLQGLFGGRLGNWIAYNLRNAAYKKLQSLSFQYYDEAKTGDLMSRLTADLDAIRQFVGFGFNQLLSVCLMVTFGYAMLFSLNWRLTLLTMIFIPFLLVIVFKFDRKVHPAFRLIRKSMSSMTTAVQENIMGVRTVKSFAREPHEVEKFMIHSGDFKENSINTSIIWAKYFPAMEWLGNLSVVVLLGAGGLMVIHKSMTIGELAAFLSLIWYVIGPMPGLGFMINNYTQSKAAAERILEVLNNYVHVKDKANAISLDKEQVRGFVSFENVSFSYSGKHPSLQKLNLDAPPGSVIGILGGTGSGKSTIIQLLYRAYNIKEGRITLDGYNINDLTIESLRRQIATVFQETFLFSASIRNNISYSFRDATMDQIIQVAKIANAHDFIAELPQGYDTIVGERGLGLSGGQKQRIAIARALLRDPKILILDDATSAVDMETEHEIQAGLKEIMKGRTTFIIAHRISSLRHADEIIVLDHGVVVQRGTHQQLLNEDGMYATTYKLQYADNEFNETAETREQNEKNGKF